MANTRSRNPDVHRLHLIVVARPVVELVLDEGQLVAASRITLLILALVATVLSEIFTTHELVTVAARYLDLWAVDAQVILKLHRIPELYVALEASPILFAMPRCKMLSQFLLVDLHQCAQVRSIIHRQAPMIAIAAVMRLIDLLEALVHDHVLAAGQKELWVLVAFRAPGFEVGGVQGLI